LNHGRRHVAGFLLSETPIHRSVRTAFSWLFVALATASCSLNPQVEPPSALKETHADAGSPAFSGGGQGGNAGFGPISGAGGQPEGGASGAGGATSQGGAYGAGGFSTGADASATPDGGAPVDAGSDAPVDGGTDGGTDGTPRGDSGPTKDARTD
jgi:hypothetical protein